MKKMLVVALAMALPVMTAQAQTKAQPSENWQTVFFGEPSVAIPLLTQAVLRRSAQLKGLELSKQISEQDILLTRKNILQSLAVGGGYTYGNQGSIGGVDLKNPTQFNTSNSGRYSAGVNLSLSLGQLLSRGNQIQIGKLNLARNESARLDREDQLRQFVIQSYQNLVLARKLLTLQQEAYVTVQTNYRLTERQFRQGQLSLPEFADANAQVTSAAAAQETARNQYETAVMLLEEIAGTKLSTLMTSR